MSYMVQVWACNNPSYLAANASNVQSMGCLADCRQRATHPQQLRRLWYVNRTDQVDVRRLVCCVSVQCLFCDYVFCVDRAVGRSNRFSCFEMPLNKTRGHTDQPNFAISPISPHVSTSPGGLNKFTANGIAIHYFVGQYTYMTYH